MPYPENKAFQELLDKVKIALAQKLPVCLYRKPFEEEVKAVFQNSDELCTTDDFEGKGFVFAPFDITEPVVLLKIEDSKSAKYHVQKKEHSNTRIPSEEGKEEHIHLVRQGLEYIAKGVVKKVVLSRKKKVESEVAPEVLIIQLLDKYPSAFCYLFFHPKVGLWCGATPETLVEIDENELKTMSLAGTLPYREDVDPNWSNKELEEQAMVTEFIADRLSKELGEVEIKGPENAKAGQLWHLKSTVKAKLSSKTSLKKIIGLLHPTPAVCGLPSDEAKDFIRSNEGYSRKYYTGFLGELRMGELQRTSLYVNLRCMEMTQGGASIYVGGGITADSIPEKEWEEIQNKSKTMLSLL